MKTALDGLIEALEAGAWTPPTRTGDRPPASRVAEAAPDRQKSPSVCWHCLGERQCSCISCAEGATGDQLIAPCVVCRSSEWLRRWEAKGKLQ